MALAFIGLGIATPAAAADWRVCMSISNDASQRVIHWAVTQPIDATGVPDFQSQFDRTKAEREALAARQNMMVLGAGHSCTESMPDLASAQARRSQVWMNFAERQRVGAGAGFQFSWEDWGWQPSGSVASSAPEAESASASAAASDQESPSPSEAPADVASSQGEGASKPWWEAAEEKRKKDAAAQAERDRLAAEKAKRESDRERQAAAAKAERDRAAASTNTDANRCVSSASLRQNDTYAGNTAAYISNGCGTPVDVRICLMTENKGWNCGMRMGLAPQASWSWSSFHATGQVFVDARVNGSGKTLASP